MANLETLVAPIKEEKENSFVELKDWRDDFSTKTKEEEDNFPAKSSSSITDENDVAIVSREQDVLDNGYVTEHTKRIKLTEDVNTAFLKLKGFFEMVQKQHPESRLELQQLGGNWRVWCGACKKLLRPDKSGKAIHNIQRQHFTSARHKKKLHLMLQAEEEEAESGRNKSAVASSSEAHGNNKHGDGKD